MDAYRVLLGGPRTPPLSLTVNNGLQMDWTTRIGIFSMVGRKLSHFGYRHEVGLSEPPRLKRRAGRLPEEWWTLAILAHVKLEEC